jgi:hypothetical protein
MAHILETLKIDSVAQLREADPSLLAREMGTTVVGREGGREEGREGGREEGKEGGREGVLG